MAPGSIRPSSLTHCRICAYFSLPSLDRGVLLFSGARPPLFFAESSLAAATAATRKLPTRLAERLPTPVDATAESLRLLLATGVVGTLCVSARLTASRSRGRSAGTAVDAAHPMMIERAVQQMKSALNRLPPQRTSRERLVRARGQPGTYPLGRRRLRRNAKQPCEAAVGLISWLDSGFTRAPGIGGSRVRSPVLATEARMRLKASLSRHISALAAKSARNLSLVSAETTACSCGPSRLRFAAPSRVQGSVATSEEFNLSPVRRYNLPTATHRHNRAFMRNPPSCHENAGVADMKTRVSLTGYPLAVNLDPLWILMVAQSFRSNPMPPGLSSWRARRSQAAPLS